MIFARSPNSMSDQGMAANSGVWGRSPQRGAGQSPANKILAFLTLLKTSLLVFGDLETHYFSTGNEKINGFADSVSSVFWAF